MDVGHNSLIPSFSKKNLRLSSSVIPNCCFSLKDPALKSKIPASVLKWMDQVEDTYSEQIQIDHVQRFLKKHSDVASLKNKPESVGWISYISENQKEDFQINYDSLISDEEDPLIKHFIYLDKGSSLNLFENNTYPILQNKTVLTFIFIGEEATAHLLKVDANKNLPKPVTYLSFVELSEKSNLLLLDVNLSESIKKIFITGKGKKNVSFLKGLNLLQNKQQAYQSVTQVHEGEVGYSRQDFRNTMSHQSYCHTHSKVVINAQEVDSNQMIKNLILDPYAHASNQPDLEVNKDQVKATHGSTVGQPDPMEIFYLNTRGISTEEALKFIIEGWTNQILYLEPNEEKIPQSFIDFCRDIRPSISRFLKENLVEILNKKLN